MAGAAQRDGVVPLSRTACTSSAGAGGLSGRWPTPHTPGQPVDESTAELSLSHSCAAQLHDTSSDTCAQLTGPAFGGCVREGVVGPARDSYLPAVGARGGHRCIAAVAVDQAGLHSSTAASQGSAVSFGICVKRARECLHRAGGNV